MKASVLTFSQTGNTLKVGRSISDGLLKNGIEVEQISFLNRNKWAPVDADIIGIGCPVFENIPADCVSDFFKKNNFNFNRKKAFVFITSGGSPAKSLWRLAKVVEKTGAKVMGGIQIRGTTTFPTMFGTFPGRPNEEDLGYAERFGNELSAALLHGDFLPDEYRIDPRQGGRFYNTVGPIMNYLKKKTTPTPKCDIEKCTLCGNCVSECPVDNITINNKVVNIQTSCIVCCRCWHVCPQNAISITFSPGNGWIERTICSEKMERRYGNVNPEEQRGGNLYKDALARKIKLKYDRKTPTSEFEYVD